MMGNRIDWTALPILVELYNLQHLDAIVDRLVRIRNAVNAPLDDE